MIICDMEKVEISFPATPKLTKAYLDNPTTLEMSIIVTDLEHIFLALSTKYDVPTCADLIAKALENMQKDMGLKGEQNEDKS